MAHGVLDERLQRERRHDGIEEPLVRLEARPQAIAEPQTLQGQVAVNELPLFAQAHFVQPLGLHAQRITQHVSQPLQGRLRRSRLARHQSHQGVEKIEDEMRVEPGPQGRELRLGAQHLGPRRAALQLDGVADAAQGGVHEQRAEPLPGERLESGRRAPDSGGQALLEHELEHRPGG